MEIAREEVKEECGYLAPLEAFTKIITFPASVGASGEKIFIFKYFNLIMALRRNTDTFLCRGG